MDFYANERTALLIDGTDLDSTCKALGFHVDFKKLLELFRNKSRLIRATYYALIADVQDYSPVRPLVDWLGYNGYMTVTKLAKETTSSSGQRLMGGSMAVELTIDAIQLSQSVDHIVLFASSADYRSLLAALQKSGCKVTVVSSRKASERSVADELRRQCDQFLELVDLQPLLELEPAGAPGPGRRRSQDVASPRGRAQANRPEDGSTPGDPASR